MLPSLLCLLQYSLTKPRTCTIILQWATSTEWHTVSVLTYKNTKEILRKSEDSYQSSFSDISVNFQGIQANVVSPLVDFTLSSLMFNYFFYLLLTVLQP